jgi:tetratricopeptide (TPR) repeat protein
MSIITQALKKAQHEQRLQQPQRAQYGSLMPVRPQAQRRWSLRRAAGPTLVGVTLLFGVGIVAYIWQTVRDPLPIAMTVPAAPPSAAESGLAFQVTPAPGPELLEPLPLEALPPAAPRRRTDLATLSPIPERPAPETAPSPAQPRAPTMSTAAKRARAQQQFDSGTEAYKAGALDEAEIFLQQAIALDPTLKHAFNGLGNLYYQREAYEPALSMYQKALDLDPDYITARNNLGNTYMQLDMSVKAIAELTKAILADSEAGLAYYNMACVYARTSEPEKAIRYLEMAIVREPEARHWAKTDTDFTAVRSTSAFQKLLGTSS